MYLDVTNRLKEQLRFIHPLLSLDELPDDFEIEIGKFTLEKEILLLVDIWWIHKKILDCQVYIVPYNQT